MSDYTLSVADTPTGYSASVSPVPPPGHVVVHFLVIVGGAAKGARVAIEPDGTAVYNGPRGIGLAAVEAGPPGDGGGAERPPLSNEVRLT